MWSKILYGCAFFNAVCVGICVAAGAWELGAVNLGLLVFNLFAAESAKND